MLRPIQTLLKNSSLIGLFLLASLPVTSTPVRSDPLAPASEEKRQAILQLLDATRLLQTTDNIIEQMVPIQMQAIRQKAPELKEDQAMIIAEEIRNGFVASRGAYLNEIISLYDRTYSLAEVNEMTAFYKTETGQKVLATMPALLGESRKLGKQWGYVALKSVAPRIKQRLAEQKK